MLFNMESALRFLALAVSIGWAWARWNGLSVRWDANILLYPTKLPRTAKDAWLQRWSPIDEECEGKKGYKGYAFVNNLEESAVTLLFDKAGYIAGIQAGISLDEHKESGFPHKKQMPPFVKTKTKTKKRYVISAYFVDPEIICTTGRTEDEFKKQGTGTNLYLQNGKKILTIPRKQEDIEEPWVEGKCWITMGKNYWYDISEDMDCDTFFPLFLLYNGGSLNGFGWAFTADFNSSEHYERITPRQHNLTMKEVPTCLKDIEVMTMMRIFLTKNTALNFC